MIANSTSRRWIVLADAARARIFEALPSNPTWTQIEEFVHQDSRASGQDLSQTNNDTGVNYRFLDYRTEAKDDEKEEFAEHLCEFLTKQERRYDELILVAEPKFLGRMRKNLGKPAAAKVLAEFGKDYTSFEAREVMEMLPPI